jgi:UDP-N-acetylmuramyl pentapeptide phosphotransferase/UDP-N-acetylglucosamine-1-phosphate transferase
VSFTAEHAVLWLLAALVSAALCEFIARFPGALTRMDAVVRHSSHTVPTPRGGGIGIVAGVLAVLALLYLDREQARHALMARHLGLSVLLVGAIGYVDDLRGLPIAPRLLTHVFAAVLIVVLLIAWRSDPLGEFGVMGWLLCAAAIVWSINLHNFMDGANGLLGAQAVFALGAIAWFTQSQSFALGATGGAVAAATLAFLPYNVPRARLFLGDVGSGALGLLIAALGLLAWREHALGLPALLILCSAFVADATCTLLHRMLRGRRWYTRHREHLYQWLLRSGHSHGAVTAAYAAWNVLLALPLAMLAEHTVGWMSWGTAISTYALATATWVCGKRRILRRAAAMTAGG